MRSAEAASTVAGTDQGLALSVRNLSYEYPAAGKGRAARVALRGISFDVPAGDFFCILGPNGSGKSTLFRTLTTASLPAPGVVSFFETDLAAGRLRDIRAWIGVVFQNAALDKKLTVRENLTCHGRLYGMPGPSIAEKSGELLGRLGLADRSGDVVETLSGGLQRRVELAKALLHSPRILLMDEPTTGLDPTARLEFLELLRSHQRDAGTTIVYTTHILEEAETCDGLLILDEGSIVAKGTPAELKTGVGRELITMRSTEPEKLMAALSGKFDLPIYRIDDVVRVECDNASSLLPELLRAYEGTVDMVQLSRPSIGDVYVKRTGHRFRTGTGGDA